MLLSCDFSTFQDRFERHLDHMLSPDELGAFILVLANSLQNQRLRTSLAPRIVSTLTGITERYAKGTLQAAADDLPVLEALLQTGVDHYPAWQQRSIDCWRVTYNPLRALRPQRAAKQTFQSLQQAFDEQRFHFDKPFLVPEILDEDRWQERTVRIMYQKFPFAAYHLLLVPDPAGHHPQVLTSWAHHLAWTLVDAVANNLAGFGLAYNSLGASASVNHLHLHGFIEPQPLAIEQLKWQHRGGGLKYPVAVEVLNTQEESWQRIEQLHADNQPFNLLYRPSLCYIIRRPAQGSYALPAWLPDAAWYELSGGFNLVDVARFESLTGDDIESGLASLSLAD